MAELPHLPLKRVEFEAPRRMKPGFRPMPERNFKGHGRKLTGQVAAALASSGASQTVGINPALILRVKLTNYLDEDVWRRSGLALIGQEDGKTLILFASDGELAKFRENLEAYQAGPDRKKQKNAPYAAVFNNIEEVGILRPVDRIGRLFLAQGMNKVEKFEDAKIYTADLELWHSGDLRDCHVRMRQLKELIEKAGGSVPDNYVGPGLVLARIKAGGALIRQLLGLDIVASIDLPPKASLHVATRLEAGLPDLRRTPPPPTDAPGLCIIDSGLTAGHPMIGPAVGEATSASTGLGPADEHGHGTMVGGLALYGDVGSCIDAGAFVPTLKLFSARVLNAQGEFDDETLVTTQMRKAIEYFREAYGCKVFNISLGDPRMPYTGGKLSSWAAILDTLAREQGVVVVVSAGNYEYEPVASETPDHHVTGYPQYLLTASAKVLEPSTGCLVLTVGSLAESAALPPREAGRARFRVIAGENQPSPFTRSGPGIGGAIKPELCEIGGNTAYDTTARNVDDIDELSVVSTHKDYASRLFGAQIGTSFAAPRVAHAAARLFAEFPKASANLVRALIASSAEVPEPCLDLLEPIDKDAVLQLCGYGRPDLGRASLSAENRVLLHAEGLLPFDRFHIYEVPIPEEFYSEKGERRISVSLAFDPPVRHSRLDYLGTRMSFRLVRGKTLQEVSDAFAKPPPPPKDEDMEEGEEVPEIAEAIKGPFNCTMLPLPGRRENGTLQKAVFKMSKATAYYGDTYYLVVRCHREWALDAHAPQAYALAVTVSHSAQVDLYARIQPRVRIPLRARA